MLLLREYSFLSLVLVSFEELLEIIHCKISLNSEHLSGAIKVSGMILMFMVYSSLQSYQADLLTNKARIIFLDIFRNWISKTA